MQRRGVPTVESMSTLVLVPWGETAWSANGRIIGRTPLPLTHAGRERCASWGAWLASLNVQVVFSGGEEEAAETAKIIVDKCGARHKLQPLLAEVDAGLWTGLTHSELRRRDSKVFKRWYDDPTSVCPPEGEDVIAASKRLGDALLALLRRKCNRNVAVILGPIAFAVARCTLEMVDLAKVRSMMHDEPMHYEWAADDETATPIVRDGTAGVEALPDLGD